MTANARHIAKRTSHHALWLEKMLPVFGGNAFCSMRCGMRLLLSL